MEEAWEILKNQYETTNQTWIQNLEAQLVNEKLSVSEMEEKFITKVKSLCNQMTAIGITITSEDLAQRCIQILPLKYDSLVMALNTRNRNLPLNFEDFSAMLLDEEASFVDN